MHYNTVKDAALCTTLVVMTGFFRPRDAPEAFLIYIGLFVILLFMLETARSWQAKYKRKAPGAGKQSGTQ